MWKRGTKKEAWLSLCINNIKRMFIILVKAAGLFSFLNLWAFKVQMHKPKGLEEIKTKERMSNTQLYKQAGNSIVVKVLEAIFKQML